MDEAADGKRCMMIQIAHCALMNKVGWALGSLSVSFSFYIIGERD